MSDKEIVEMNRNLIRAACNYAIIYEMEQKMDFGGVMTDMRQDREDELHCICREFFKKVTAPNFLTAPSLGLDGAVTRPEGQKVSG